MAKYYKQIRGKIIDFHDENWENTNKYYKYGSLNKEPYFSEEVPKCRLCGSELNIVMKRNYGLITSCTNENCPTKSKAYGTTRLKAFLPENIFQSLNEKRKKHHKSYFNKDYLINKRGFSEEEAQDYIEQHKKMISERQKGKTKEYYKKKYGEEYVEEILNRSKEKNILCLKYWLHKGYNEEEAKAEISKIQQERSKKAVNKQSFLTKAERIKRYGLEETEKFYKEKSRLCIEYWLKRGYTEEEGKAKISELQAKNSSMVKHRRSNRSIDYWTNKGIEEEEARKIISSLQSTFSLEKCLDKYGDIEGHKIWSERQQKWQDSLHKNGKLHIGYSHISQELFSAIESLYNEEDRDYIFYGSKNREYSIRENGTIFVYDFVDLNRRKIIEFNGDIYHGNPKFFSKDDTPHPFRRDVTAEKLWEYDEYKKKIAEKNGFSEIIIWEDDYKKNKEKIIETCKKFLLC